MSKIELHKADCLEFMENIPDKSVDMVLCDLPYGTTNCKWDCEIDLSKLWTHYQRIIKPEHAIVLFAQQPFTTKLISSNYEWFKYCWIWEKNRCPNFMMAKYAPLKTTEDIVVFSDGKINTNTKNKMVYYPQGLKDVNIQITSDVKKEGVNIYNCLNKSYTQTKSGYPKNILKFDTQSGSHPTQKPVALCEYLIKTYTKEGDLVLDNCAGSMTTGVACQNLNRNCILIEKDEKYFEIGKERIKNETFLL